MSVVNKARGEVELEVGGRSYVLRPSFETLSAIEDATGKGAMDLILSIRSTTITMKDIVVILWIAAKGSKNKEIPKVAEFGEDIRRGQGLTAAGWIALGFLSSSISTDEQMEEAAKEAEEGDTKDVDPSEPSEESSETGTPSSSD
jgi:hypothetical protein